MTAFRDLVMTAAACTTPPRPTLSREDARADAAAVERIIRRGWAGFETISAAGVDWTAVFGELAAWIARSPEPIAVESFQDHLVLALHRAADNHLAFFWFTEKGHARRKAVGRNERAYTADLVVLPSSVVADGAAPKRAKLLTCDGRPASALLAPTVIAEGDALAVAARPIVLAESPPPPLHCTFALLDGRIQSLDLPMRRLRIPRRTTETPSSPAVEVRNGPLPLVTIRTFWTGKDTELAEFVASGRCATRRPSSSTCAATAAAPMATRRTGSRS